ncbi:proline--tRNA ligase [Synechococcus sp. MIT S1220]|uniref:proline--tRNA ligase n=1 Tax=Synechococcus sp. MIT S1220 TaxID=3082549 RepID=UPI0039AEC4D4
MRVSRLMLVTLRDVPADAEIASHQLLLRGGYIRRVGSGIYAYLPLMWKVLRRITTIVRDEMDRSGGLETLLPQLHPSELWQRSGRWQGYTAGEGIMFHLEDRQGRELGLGPTHEEVITSLAGELLRSYKQLPVNLYQIQTKFRDEIRPRFGLMRGREFIMKDAYSFHSSETDLQNTYVDMDQAYRRIFERCGLEAVPVEADSGAIGGAASQEFMVTAEAGEDLILISEDGTYAANQEKAVSQPHPPVPLEDAAVAVVATPGQTSIESLCTAQGWHPSQVVKVLLLLARLDSGAEQPVLVSLRGDQELNEVKLVNAVSRRLETSVLDCRPISADDVMRQGLKSIPFGAIGPDLADDGLKQAISWTKSFLRLVDPTASALKRFICGANRPDVHRKGCSWNDLDLPEPPLTADLRNARAGEPCLHNPEVKLTEKRGIEVGHIFQLGRKYSQALDSSFTNEAGQQEPFWMGCYGIGISRLAQAAVEQHHDEAGISWPASIAPFEAIVVVANIQDATQASLGETLYESLLKQGIDVLLDDRKERAGVKFKDADLIGIPWRIVVGRDAAEGMVELVQRSDRSMRKLPHAEALAALSCALRP